MTLLGSIVLSIVANLLTPLTQKVLSRVSAAYSRRAHIKQTRNQIIINYLREDKSRIYILKLDVLHQLMWSILIQGFALSALIAFDGVVGKLISIGMTITNLRFMIDTMNLFSKVKAAEAADFEEINERLAQYDIERNKANHGDR